MAVWDVLGKRRADDQFEVVGAVAAPDVDMAMLLARETHFRHKEGVVYAVRLRGSDRLHVGPYEAREIGGVTDRSYRRQEAYAGVGARLKKLTQEFEARKISIPGARPHGPSSGHGHLD